MKAWTKNELREWKPCANASLPETGLFFSGKQIVQTCCLFCCIIVFFTTFSQFCFFGMLPLSHSIYFQVHFLALESWLFILPTLFLSSYRIAKVKWVPYNWSKWWIESATLVGMPIDKTKDFILTDLFIWDSHIMLSTHEWWFHSM